MSELTGASAPGQTNPSRCPWVDLAKEDYVRYHDLEWGVPLYDDRAIFEFLILEGAQAGLSWYTVLRKRENYRNLFEDFDPVKVAAFDERRIEALLADPGIIRNRQKVHAAVNNALRFLDVQREFGDFSRYIWGFVGGKAAGKPREGLERVSGHQPRIRRLEQRPAATWLQVHGIYNHVRPHAGHRHGQRPHP